MQKKKRKKRTLLSLTPGHPVERAKNRRLTSGNSSKTTNPRDGGGELVGEEDIGDDTYEGREQARTPLLRHRHARDHRPQAARTRWKRKKGERRTERGGGGGGVGGYWKERNAKGPRGGGRGRGLRRLRAGDGVQGGPRGCKDGGWGGGEREKGRASVMIRRCFNDSAFLWQRACRGRPPRRPASVSTRVEGALSGQPPY